MNSTNRYLDAIKSKTGAPSDYVLASKMELTRSAISAYRKKNVHFDDKTCLKVASILEIDPFLVVSEIHMDRAKTEEEKTLWKSLFQKLGGVAALLLITTGVTALQPAPAMAAGISNADNDLYIMRSVLNLGLICTYSFK
ncbi:MAG: DUF3693 domain-containing protein [Methylophilus sp.]|uniref:DUF3693 domain-containing protein n=1 Tax=Methylophilus sp. TaxID=29541 RepID=UPI003FA0E69B